MNTVTYTVLVQAVQVAEWPFRPVWRYVSDVVFAIGRARRLSNHRREDKRREASFRALSRRQLADVGICPVAIGIPGLGHVRQPQD